ncbi:DUF3077 domain-containing protein [Pseudomonas silvicola]|nr:DUF3077 domain-containing protein [Pseudomonas silvicola]
MSDLVPAPPKDPTPFTTETAFGPLTGANLTLFTVRPGLPAEEALMHASHLLDCLASKQAMSLFHLVELAKPLVVAAIDGIHHYR